MKTTHALADDVAPRSALCIIAPRLRGRRTSALVFKARLAEKSKHPLHRFPRRSIGCISHPLS
jgi:hypothetical protein